MPGLGLLATSVAINVLTLNVWGLPDIGFMVPSPLRPERMQAICEVLRKDAAKAPGEGWDLVLLQEAWDATDRATLKNCGYTYNFEQEDPTRSLDSGLMILSRYPIASGMRLTYSEQASGDLAFSTGEAFARKSALLAQILIPHARQAVWIANTHLISFYTTNAAPDSASDEFLESRRAQWRQYIQWTKGMTNGAPLILGGDLNFGVGSVQWSELNLTLGQGSWTEAPDSDATCTLCPPNVMHTSNEGKVDQLFGLQGTQALTGGVEFQGTFSTPADPSLSIPYSDHMGYRTEFTVPASP